MIILYYFIFLIILILIALRISLVCQSYVVAVAYNIWPFFFCCYKHVVHFEYTCIIKNNNIFV